MFSLQRFQLKHLGLTFKQSTLNIATKSRFQAHYLSQYWTNESYQQKLYNNYLTTHSTETKIVKKHINQVIVGVKKLQLFN